MHVAAQDVETWTRLARETLASIDFSPQNFCVLQKTLDAFTLDRHFETKFQMFRGQPPWSATYYASSHRCSPHVDEKQEPPRPPEKIRAYQERY